MSRPAGQLDRSLAALTIGMRQNVVDRERNLRDTITGPSEQFVHIDLNGQAAPGWGSTDKKVQWREPFLCPRPLQCQLPFPTPHFKADIEQTAGFSELILFRAHVIDWTVTESAWFVGATIRFAVSAPNAPGLTPYSAIAHLSFTGYSAMAETDEFA